MVIGKVCLWKQHFGMINYTLHKGYIERDLEMNEKNYLLSTIKFLKTIQTNKRKKCEIRRKIKRVKL